MKENHLGDKTVLADLLRDEDIQLTERMILQAFEGPGDYTKAQHLLELRKEMINRRALAGRRSCCPISSHSTMLCGKRYERCTTELILYGMT